MQKPDYIKNIDVLNDDLISRDYCRHEDRRYNDRNSDNDSDNSDVDDHQNHVNHEYCTYITSLIADYVIYDKKEIPIKLIDRYIRIVCNELLCWSLQYNDHVKYCNYIFEHNKHLACILYVNNAELFDMCKKHDTDLKEEMFGIFNLVLTYSNSRVIQTIDKMIKLNYYNEELIKIVVKHKLISPLITLLNEKVHIDQKYFITIMGFVSNHCNSIDVINKCIKNGCYITNNTIKEYIQSYYINTNIHKHYNYYPTISNASSIVNIFKYLYENNSRNIEIDDILELADNIQGFQKQNYIQTIDAIINFLVEKNYNISQDEFEQICDLGIKIKNVSKVEKYFENNNIKNKIYLNNIPYNIKFEQNVEMLKHECSKSGNISKIRNLVKTVKPTEECLENACLVTSNTATVRLLHEEHNIKMTEKCLLNVAKDLRHNNSIDYVIKLYLQKN